MSTEFIAEACKESTSFCNSTKIISSGEDDANSKVGKGQVEIRAANKLRYATCIFARASMRKKDSAYKYVFTAAAINDMPVLTVLCCNQALCCLDMFGNISVYGRSNVFGVSVCRLCESWSSIRTQVGATRDCEMPPDSESRMVLHCPQVVADVE